MACYGQANMLKHLWLHSNFKLQVLPQVLAIPLQNLRSRLTSRFSSLAGFAGFIAGFAGATMLPSIANSKNVIYNSREHH